MFTKNWKSDTNPAGIAGSFSRFTTYRHSVTDLPEYMLTLISITLDMARFTDYSFITT